MVPRSAVLRPVMIVGGAIFIGSHFTDRLLAESATVRVTLFDNFTSWRRMALRAPSGVHRLTVVRGDFADLPALTSAIDGHTAVIHLASNPDIAAAMTDPAIDSIRARD